MIPTSVELPEGLHAAALAAARDAGLSVGEWVAAAVAEKVSATGAGWWEARAARGDRAAFEAALARVADAEPDERDRLGSSGAAEVGTPSEG